MHIHWHPPPLKKTNKETPKLFHVMQSKQLEYTQNAGLRGQVKTQNHSNIAGKKALQN